MEGENAIQHVSDTAFLVAHYRAVESSRPRPLFHDPLAARLAGEKGPSVARTFATGAITEWNVAIRTRVIDHFVGDAVARGVDTVLSLGAGLDTRPYRLKLPCRLRWIEADYPDVIAFKERGLADQRPHCTVQRLAVDLEDAASRHRVLSGAGAEAGRLLVLTEGVVPYLTLEQVAALAEELHALPSIDSWIIDYFSQEAHGYRARMAAANRQMQHAAFRFQPEDWFGFFAAHGWCARETRYLQEEGSRIGRPAPLPWKFQLLSALSRLILPAEKRAALGRFVGYVLLEPVLTLPGR
jgi:methyltransferase (TIGR00027 family)